MNTNLKDLLKAIHIASDGQFFHTPVDLPSEKVVVDCQEHGVSTISKSDYNEALRYSTVGCPICKDHVFYQMWKERENKQRRQARTESVLRAKKSAKLRAVKHKKTMVKNSKKRNRK